VKTLGISQSAHTFAASIAAARAGFDFGSGCIPKTPMSRQNSRSAFSLVELLAVIVVIAIIMGIVVPSLSGLGRGPALTAAGSTVNNMVSLARQHAMSRNTLTALVILANQGTESDYRALAVLEYKPRIGWTQVGGWETLPVGITVDVDPAECSFMLNSPNPFPFLTVNNQENPPIQFQSTPVRSPGGYAARIFTPGGGLQNADKPAQIRLVPGNVVGGSIQYKQRNDAGKPANYFDIAIIGATGATKISRP
jgi:prepilin-type N-terminal cleavage/methylation domain-containing protein